MTGRPDDLDTPHAFDAPEPWQDPAPADIAGDDGSPGPAAPRLWPVVRGALDERGWVFDQVGETSALVRVRGAATNYDVALVALEEPEVVRCAISLHLYVAEPWRAAALDLVNRINHDELLLGGFELDPESGRVRWRLGCDVQDGRLSPTMVHNLVNAGFWACDRFFPAFVAVGVLGTSPEAALEIAAEE
jgi:hypothetical protein